MADNMDIIKSNPIGILNDASKVSLQSGGALFISAILAVYVTNAHDWVIDPWLVRIAFVSGILLSLVGSFMKRDDAHLRASLAKALIEKIGTSDPAVAERILTTRKDEENLLKQILKEPITVNLFQAPGVEIESITPVQKPT